LKAKRKDNIEALFRQKLDKAEVVPDPSVSTTLMRKLARREFLRFNPAKFNIYYLGGILASVITAVIVLSSGSNRSDLLAPTYFSGENNKTEIISKIGGSSEKTTTQESDILSENSIDPTIKNEVTSAEPKNANPVQKELLRDNSIIIPANVGDSFSKKGLFTELSPDIKKLQSGFKGDEFLFESSVKEGCIPLKIRFTNKSKSYDSCRWSFGDGGYSKEKNPEWIFDVEGEYKVVLHLYNSDGMQATSSTIITAYPRPSARFEIAHEKDLLADNEIRFYNYSANAVKFKWNFGDGNTSELFEPIHRYAEYGSYNVSLEVNSEYGCSDSQTVSNAFSGSEYYINFPNAFIPNMQGPTGGYYSSKSDEDAQVFHPAFSGISDYQLKIFSKLGILIFESSDINIGWDGYLNGKLCEPGVYIWKVRGSFRNGEPFTKMGDVTLLRN